MVLQLQHQSASLRQAADGGVRQKIDAAGCSGRHLPAKRQNLADGTSFAKLYSNTASGGDYE
jgi:hypothetical protein